MYKKFKHRRNKSVMLEVRMLVTSGGSRLLTGKECVEAFWGDVIFKNLDLGSGYVAVYICKIS